MPLPEGGGWACPRLRCIGVRKSSTRARGREMINDVYLFYLCVRHLWREAPEIPSDSAYPTISYQTGPVIIFRPGNKFKHYEKAETKHYKKKQLPGCRSIRIQSQP